ncbi:MAG: hotdog fold thioesterase [Crocinitomix sp.]|nr:hotdog fold thioesterase [Crocinitomix sp.]
MTNKEIVDQMIAGDEMSQWLGIKVLDYSIGNVVCEMTVRQEMVNGFNIAHGGITYSLADSALAFSINAHGIQSVSVETSISHVKPVKVGDVLTTETKEISVTSKIGVLTTEVYNQDKVLVAAFKGTVYRTGKAWA